NGEGFEAVTVLGLHLRQEDFKLMCLQALLQVDDFCGMLLPKRDKSLPSYPAHQEPSSVRRPAESPSWFSEGNPLIPPLLSGKTKLCHSFKKISLGFLMA
uniref:Uncharacterized protein n=1 Tax=Serinus canaria TaxID=9135 RepID=A0A8C9NLC0_SERCA